MNLQHLKHALNFILINGQDMLPEERQYVFEKNLHKVLGLGNAMIPLATVTLFLSTCFVYLLSPTPINSLLATCHGTVFLMLCLCWALRRKIRFDLRIAWLLIQLTFALGHAGVLYRILGRDPDINAAVFLSTMNVAILIFNIVACPYYNGIALLMAAIYVSASVIACWASPALKGPDWAIINLICAFFALLIFYARVYRSIAATLDELAARQLLIQADRRRLQGYERDMALASEIQDSFAPRESLMTGNGLAVAFFQKKYDLLGGDWCAARCLPSGETALVVADATGKGIQAALVIHSIQTLWANALSVESFDPEQWLRAANQTLLALGQRREHTMSLGLAIIRSSSILYYSAGHLPLFLLLKPGSDQEVLPIIARGPLLGMSPTISFEPKEVSLPLHKVEALLLGTDGVFDRPASMKRGAVRELVDKLQSRGADALNDYHTNDDKLLIWVHPAA